VAKSTPRRRAIALTVSGLVLIASVAAVLWAVVPYGPMNEAEGALLSDSVVRVDRTPFLTFTPRSNTLEVGLIVYPGARVAPAAYAPAARAIAEEGFLVVVVQMPLNLAVLAPDRANQIIELHPEIKRWAIGGHSLGGAMAARFALNSGAADGLVLWAAYPAQSDDLSQLVISVTSIYASQDGLATPAEVLASAARLPASARLVRINGGNHAQFGWYGPQPGDQPASISRAEQEHAVVQATIGLLRRMADSP
jgi:pimeloyl-ACP methyl ester carboxylesterase